MTLENIFAESPEETYDIKTLDSAIKILTDLERRHKKEYVFRYSFQPMMGSACYAVPKNTPVNSNSASQHIRVYDKQFLENRKKYLKKLQEFQQEELGAY